MTKQIFRSICLVAIVVFLASLLLILGVLYDYFSKQQMESLKNETALCGGAVEAEGLDYLRSLSHVDHRITWISGDGTVLFDNKAQIETMENHLEREEIAEALEKGEGESARRSDTLMEKQLYAAKKLLDGTILRLSASHLTWWSLIFSMMQPILIVMGIAVGVSMLLAYRLSKTVVNPLNEARREFTANVSHELKTPLQTISGSAELLAKGIVKTEDVPRFAEQIFGESKRMITLVEDIIKLSHLDEGAEDMQWQTVDLYALAALTLENLVPAARHADVSLHLSGEKTELQGIPQLLTGILYNLCDNAIKYNRHGGSVSIDVRSTDTLAVLTIRDTGIGIPPEAQERIFERFYRVDKSRSKSVGGTGLGLSIVKHSVKQHQGEIRVNSVVDEGTTMTIILPKERKNG